MSILPFFWPTKKLILDDNQMFVQALKELLQNDTSCIFSTNVHTSLALIKKQNFDFAWYVHAQGTKRYAEESYQINYSAISDITQNSARFEVISVAMLDYHMPAVSGIEFCQQIPPNLEIQKVLLTGSMGYQGGVTHLNHQVIDNFLSKNDITADIIEDTLKIEEHNFFRQHALLILNSLRLKDNTHPILSSEYTDFFNALIKEHDICEYYLLDDSGSYALLNAAGKKKILLLFLEDEIQEMYEEALYRGLDKSLCDSLYSAKKALCYYDRINEGWPVSAEWKQYMHPIQKIEINNKSYYTAVIDV
jgi:CheY-like chemotaxis protein